ncbi:MAG TPA: endopeptidase La [Bryobacteraceae bacterium]|nr:endopeptidase La [Bryobacteraceae bacterium]
MSDPERLAAIPLLPIKNAVLFPHMLLPLSVGRPSSVAAVERAMAGEEKHIVIVAQRDASVDEPRQEDLFTVGTNAVIKKLGRRPDGAIELVVQGLERVTILKVEQVRGTLHARVQTLPAPQDTGDEVEALRRAVLDIAQQAIALTQVQAPEELARLILVHEDPARLVYMLGSVLSLEVEKEQALLEAPTRLDALRLMHTYLSHEVHVLALRNKIVSEAETEISKEQREYMLRQQLRAIQQELGEQGPEQAESELLRDRLAQADLSEEVRKQAERELKRLQKLPPAAPDYHVIRSYLELVVDLPWRKRSPEAIDIARARAVLDEDHYDLKEVKGRILEQLGVLKMNPQAKAPILCFAGPPGTGKTSLGQSIARAMGRKFERMSLGGLHDEAELRGHRRTYIGAMPGRIIEAIRRAGVNNPLLMLDEVDKLGQDFRGDPASALLEILDPEQNKNFHDNYLDLPFDLSKVFFITTANTFETIPRPLLDRMEILTLSGYSEEEKCEIARRYLIPRQMQDSGLTSAQFTITSEALRKVVECYTREAGLRQLERAIGRLAHKAALSFAEGKSEPVTVRPEDLSEMLGPERFFLEQARDILPPGVAVGLAWTETGGDVLYVEGTLLPEGQGLTLTGHLGEVMQESAKAAHSYIWSHCDELSVDRAQFHKSGVHIHVPAGAIPKDGPSAGVTMLSALASLYVGHATRKDTAMTGEITLTGLVLPIGGVKEKVLAARRAGLRRIILPKENEKDLRELPDDVRAGMEFVFVRHVKEVLSAAIPELAERLACEPVAC